ncbi:MAG: hypothetical protein ACTSWN_01075 [Promethearchaeota archaeon]
MENLEDKIKALLSLKAKIEQELRSDMMKIEDLKKECELKRKWLYYIDEILSESSFVPASVMLSQIENLELDDLKPAMTGKEEPSIMVEYQKNTVNLISTINSKLLSSLKFTPTMIIITFNEDFKIFPNDPYFYQDFQEKIIDLFEKAGGKIFYEKDETGGFLRTIMIKGSFNSELKETCIKNLRDTLINIQSKEET